MCTKMHNLKNEIIQILIDNVTPYTKMSPFHSVLCQLAHSCFVLTVSTSCFTSRPLLVSLRGWWSSFKRTPLTRCPKRDRESWRKLREEHTTQLMLSDFISATMSFAFFA